MGDVVDEDLADVGDVFGEDDEEGSFGQAGVAGFFAEADAGDEEGFFVSGFDGVWFCSGLVVAHVFDCFELEAVGGEVVVEALHAGAVALQRGVADNALFVLAFCGFLFLFALPPLVDGGFFYWRPERVAALFDGGACPGNEELPYCVAGLFFFDGDSEFCLQVVDALFELFEAGDGDGDVVAHR